MKKAALASLAPLLAVLAATGCSSGPETPSGLRVTLSALSEEDVDGQALHLRLGETAAAILAEQFSKTPGLVVVLPGDSLEKTRTAWEFLSEDPAREIQVSPGKPDAVVSGSVSAHRGELRARASLAMEGREETVEVSGPAGPVEQNKLLFRELALKLAAKLLPEDPLVLVRLGVTLREEGLIAEAVEAYRRAAALKPDLASAHFNLGVALDAAGDIPGALEAYAKAIGADSTQVPARFNSALDLLRERSEGESDEAFGKRVARAKALLEEVVGLSPRMADAYELLVEALLLSGEPGSAVEVCDRMRKGFPGDARPHELLGGVYLSLKRFADAVPELRRAAEIEPAVATHAYSLARALEGAGDLEEAASLYEEFLARAGADPLFARACEDARGRLAGLKDGRKS